MTPPTTVDLPAEAVLGSTADALRNRPAPWPRPELVPEGPLDLLHVFWLAGMSCDGCSIAAIGATNPSVEDLLAGNLPGLPKVVLHHPVLSVEAGEAFVKNFRMAVDGELEAPYVVIYEGSLADESIAARTGGYWAGLGVEKTENGDQPVPTSVWLERMADGAAAVIAIGTCATWGGVPSSVGNPTGAHSVMDHLGEAWRSSYGLPVVNIPGCAPVGDNFTETVAAILLYLQGIGPIPDFDALGRPAWLFSETVHHGCTRAGFYEEGLFAEEYGDAECLVEVGCWGPVVNCNIVKRGAINHMGGCMEVGGVCIGCTMPGFPDKFSPFYKTPPGSYISTTGSRALGAVMRRLRRLSNEHLNRETLWDETGHVPTGWDKVRELGPGREVVHWAYKIWQFWRGKPPGHEGKGIDFPMSRPGRDEDYPGSDVMESFTIPAIFASWTFWFAVGAAIVVVAAALLITILLVARSIRSEALRALDAARRIEADVASIPALAGVVDALTSVHADAMAVADATEHLAGAVQGHGGGAPVGAGQEEIP